jgi:hypothetical protein
VIDEEREGEPPGDPDRRPGERLPHADQVGLAVEDPEVQGQHQQDEDDEADPDQEHARPF